LAFRLALVLAVALTASCGSRVDEEAGSATGPAARPGDSAGITVPEGVPSEGQIANGGSSPAGAGGSPALPSAQPGAKQAGGSGGSPSSGAGSGAALPNAQPAAPRPSQPTAGQSQAASGSPEAAATASSSPAYPDAVSITGPHSQGVSDTTIRLGLGAPVSGAAGFLGENMVDAMRAYTSSVNSMGGVGGRKYQMVVVDTQFQPSVEATAVKRLVEQDKVFAVFTPFGDSAAPYITSKGVPSFGFGVTNPSYSSKYPTTYGVGTNVLDMVATQAYVMTKVMNLPIKSTAIVYDTQNVPLAGQAKYIARAWEYLGVQVKSIDAFNLSDGDCTRLVLKIKNLNVDYWNAGQSLGWPICMQAMARQNYLPPLGHGGAFTEDEHFIGQAGRAAADIYGIATGVQIAKNRGQPYATGAKAPLVDRFVTEMQKYSPSSADVESLETLWTQTFWSATRLLDEAVRRQTDAITWGGVNQWIQSQREWTSGLFPPMSFDPKCKISPTPWIFQWKWDGSKFEQSDWQPYGGRVEIPLEMKNHIVPGAGECYLTAVADADQQ
jgi:ABC-type branched-subunit amino acid transport system substrate-binding protein